MRDYRRRFLSTLSAVALVTGAVFFSVESHAQDIKVPTTQSIPADMQSDPVADAVAQSPESGTIERSHPEMADVIKKLVELGAKPFHTLTVEQARTGPTPADAVKALVSAKTGQPAVPEPTVVSKDIAIPGAVGDLEARIYWPAGKQSGGEPLPVVVYFHGGGWVVANLNVYDASPRALAELSQSVVISVHYRQGPEDRFPAAHDDAVAVYKYIVEHAQDWNGDGQKIAVAGESAGGNLAINVAISARDQKLKAPDAIIAIYPVAGSDMNTRSYLENQNAIPLGKADVKWFIDHYLASPDQAMDDRINLVAADLAGLPPVTIVAAEIDPLRSEGETLRDKLKASGVDVTYQLWKGVTHEFFSMGAIVPEAKEAEKFAGDQLKKAFGTTQF